MAGTDEDHPEAPCPNCGLCPTCGRLRPQTPSLPFYPYPYYAIPAPAWPQPWTIIYDSSSTGQ